MIVKPVGLKGTYVPGSGWSVLALFFYAGMVAFVLWELCLVWQKKAPQTQQPLLPFSACPAFPDIYSKDAQKQ